MNSAMIPMRTAAVVPSPGQRGFAEHDGGASFGQALAAEQKGVPRKEAAERRTVGDAGTSPTGAGTTDAGVDSTGSLVPSPGARIAVPGRGTSAEPGAGSPGTGDEDTSVGVVGGTPPNPDPDGDGAIVSVQPPAGGEPGAGTAEATAGRAPSTTSGVVEGPAAGEGTIKSGTPDEPAAARGALPLAPPSPQAAVVAASPTAVTATATATAPGAPVTAMPGVDVGTPPSAGPSLGPEGGPTPVATASTAVPAANASAPSTAPTLAGPALGPVQTVPTVVSATPVAAPALAPQPPEPLNRQLSGPIATMATGPHGERTMTINVAPHGLGPVTVKAHLGIEGLRVEMMAPTEAGRDALRVILGDLRRDLAVLGHGSLSLSTADQPDPGSGDEPRQQDPTPGEARPRGGAADQGTGRMSTNRPRAGQLPAHAPGILALEGAANPPFPSPHSTRLDVLA